MANKNRNRSSYASDENWDRGSDRREDDYSQNRENQAGYGNVGYGSEYNRSMRGDYGRQTGNQERYGNISDYGGAYSSDYGPNFTQREKDYDNRRRWDNSSENAYGNQYRQDQWRNTENYNRGNERDWQDWRYRDVNTGSDSDRYRGSRYGGQQNREQQSIYGGDTSNYGNMNQGGYDRGWWDRTRDEVSSWFGDDDAERRRRIDRQQAGTNRGKGPKGYERSPERIREDVCERLSYDDRIDATDIDVKVNGHEVTLDGTVDTREARHRAEDIIETIPGVTHIQNNLRVQRTGSEY
jgi:osmotically-inducible protein OsmY